MENYFTLFEMPVSFLPDKNLVRKRFLELSKQHHPDHFTQGAEADQSAALETSALINKAYKVFNNSDATLKYVLTLKGVLEDDEKYNLPPAFLGEMMEINEQVDELSFDEDSSAKEAIRQQLHDFEKDLYEPVATIMENYQEGITSEEELLPIKDYYFKKKYLARIYEALDGKS